MLTIVLAGITLMLYFIYFFYTGGDRSAYLLFVILFIPFMDLGVTPYAFGGLSVFDIITYITVFLCYKDFIYGAKKHTAYLYLFFIFIGLLFLGSLASEFSTKSLFGLLSIIPPFIYARLLIKELEENELFLEKIINYIKIAGLIAIGIIIVQMLVGVKFTFYEVLNQNVNDNGNVRYPGYFPDSQLSSLFLAMISFFFLLNLKKAKNPELQNYVLFGLVMIAVILAGSRSGLLGLGAGLLFLLIFVGGNFRVTSLFFGVIFAGLLLFFSDSFLLFKRFNEVNDSISFRATIWDGAYKIFKKNYLVGIGINNYKDFVTLHAQDQFLLLDNDEIFFIDAPENGYLLFLVEFGLFATTALFLMILSPIIHVLVQFFKGKKVAVVFFFIAPVICLFLSLSTFSSLGDSRIVILLATCISFCIVYSSDPKTINEN